MPLTFKKLEGHIAFGAFVVAGSGVEVGGAGRAQQCFGLCRTRYTGQKHVYMAYILTRFPTWK